MIGILIAKVDALTFAQFKFQTRRKCAVPFYKLMQYVITFLNKLGPDSRVVKAGVGV